MDLNIVIEKYGQKDSVKTIEDKIAKSIKLGIKEVALAIETNFDQLSTLESPSIIHLHKYSDRIKIHSRLTLEIEEAFNLHKIYQWPIVKQFTIFAIRPLSEKVFTQLLGNNIDFDLISIDLHEKVPFNLKKANFSLPISRGILSEINYTQLFLSQSNRINTISNGQLLVEKNKSKNILLSSGTNSPIFLRDPFCVASLGLLFNLKENQSYEAVYVNGLKVLKHANERKNAATRAVTMLGECSGSEVWLENELIDDRMDS